MCLAIPGKVMSIENRYDGKVKFAKVSFDGLIKEASLELLPDVQINDYVLIHVGVAISKIDEQEAEKVFQYLRESGDLEELEPNHAL
ncbi:MAG: HypC/HybG/HupF family hydrogenase formation chaperone [Alphaproteobacteria bacterium]|nr:HypC/HybG/HupF family hydrogenase formation chaperone [Alphaproteobacteria bacterium]